MSGNSFHIGKCGKCPSLRTIHMIFFTQTCASGRMEDKALSVCLGSTIRVNKVKQPWKRQHRRGRRHPRPKPTAKANANGTFQRHSRRDKWISIWEKRESCPWRRRLQNALFTFPCRRCTGTRGEHGIKAQLNINSRNRQVGAWSWRLEAKESVESPCCQL